MFFNLPFHHAAEHALSVIVKMAQSLVKPVPNLAGNHGSCNELRMRMLQAGSRISAVILEDGDVVDPAVHSQKL